MDQLLLFIVAALLVAAIVFGVTVMLSGGDSGLTPVEPDGRAVPLPSDRPLGEDDISDTRFDTAWRGYRMEQVDQALQRAAYDIGYKGELISVLEAEVNALRDGRTADADVLRRAREAAVQPASPSGTDIESPDAEPAAVPAAGGACPSRAATPPPPAGTLTSASTSGRSPNAAAAQASPAVPAVAGPAASSVGAAAD